MKHSIDAHIHTTPSVPNDPIGQWLQRVEEAYSNTEHFTATQPARVRTPRRDKHRDTKHNTSRLRATLGAYVRRKFPIKHQ